MIQFSTTYCDFRFSSLQKPAVPVKFGINIPRRQSPVLSRHELRQVIRDMVD